MQEALGGNNTFSSPTCGVFISFQFLDRLSMMTSPVLSVEYQPSTHKIIKKSVTLENIIIYRTLYTIHLKSANMLFHRPTQCWPYDGNHSRGRGIICVNNIHWLPDGNGVNYLQIWWKWRHLPANVMDTASTTCKSDGNDITCLSIWWKWHH